eukprot:759599-Hanusia_phi.AAC.1
MALEVAPIGEERAPAKGYFPPTMGEFSRLRSPCRVLLPTVRFEDRSRQTAGSECSSRVQRFK